MIDTILNIISISLFVAGAAFIWWPLISDGVAFVRRWITLESRLRSLEAEMRAIQGRWYE
jgi:hypothetical protein